MRKLLVIFCAVISILGCSQKEKTLASKDTKVTYDINQYIFPEAKDITEDNFVEKLNSQIKHYDIEPIYYLRTNKKNCIIEIYVNGISIFDDYEISNYITPVEIGHILKSFLQKVTVKMYPVGNLNNESLGIKDAAPEIKLNEQSQVSISVIRIDEKSSKRLHDEEIITKALSPTDSSGKEFYEFSFTFNAQVPYEFEGWTKGQDLKKLNQDLVRKKAIEFYKMCGNIHVKNDLNAWLKLNYPSDIRIKSSFYRDKQNLKETLNEYKNTLKGVDFRMTDIKDFKMEYMGDEKLLMLITNNLTAIHRGGGALYLSDNSGLYQPSITLYLPKGRDLATQGFMMWK